MNYKKDKTMVFLDILLMCWLIAFATMPLWVLLLHYDGIPLLKTIFIIFVSVVFMVPAFGLVILAIVKSMHICREEEE